MTNMITVIPSRFCNTSTGAIITVLDTERRGRWTYIKTDAGEIIEDAFNKSFVPAPDLGPSDQSFAPPSEPTADVPARDSFSGFKAFRAKNPIVCGEDKVRHLDNGDRVAQALRSAASSAKLWEVPMVVELLDVPALKTRYANLNGGLLRMVVGNLLRSALQRREAQVEGDSDGAAGAANPPGEDDAEERAVALLEEAISRGDIPGLDQVP